MLAIAIIRTIADPKASRNLITKKLSDLHGFLVRLESAEMKSEYQVEKLLDQVKG
jgi:hypothetical protein